MTSMPIGNRAAFGPMHHRRLALSLSCILLHLGHGIADSTVMLAGGNAQTGTLFNSTSTRLIVPGASEVYFYHQANNSWRSAANFSNSPAGRGAFQMVKLPDGKILAAGGDLSLKNSSDAFIGLGYFGRSAETFDPVTNSWTVTGDMSASRFDQNMVQLPDGKVVAVGGRGHFLTNFANANSTVEIYDPDTRSWTAGPMYTLQYRARKDFQLQALPNKSVLLCGGREDSTASLSNATVLIFDPKTKNWSTTANMSLAVHLHQTALLPSGSVVSVGGYTGYSRPSAFTWDLNATLVARNTTQIYDPDSQTWKLGNSMVEARADFALVPLQDGRVMACGGLATLEGPPPAINIFITNENWLLTCEAYDETSDIWEPLQDLPFKQNTTSIKLLLLPDGNVFATGTYYPKFSIVTYATKRLLVSAIYDPAEDSWEQTSVFPGHVHSSYQMIAL